MTKTLGQKYDAVQNAIEKTLAGEEYKISDRELKRVPLEALQKRESHLEKQIALHGRDYIPGQNTQAVSFNVPVQFN